MNNTLGVLTEWAGNGAVILLARFALNLFFTTIVVRLVYYRVYRSRDYVFTYFLINLVTFSLVYLLNNVPIQMGSAWHRAAQCSCQRRHESRRARDRQRCDCRPA